MAYSHLSNKPILKNSILHKRKSTLHIYWFHKHLPPSTFIPASTFTLFSNHYYFQPPFLQLIGSSMTVFLTKMKVIQEIRLELVSLDPFLLCKYTLRWFLKKKSTLHTKIHPPRLLIFQKRDESSFSLALVHSIPSWLVLAEQKLSVALRAYFPNIYTVPCNEFELQLPRLNVWRRLAIPVCITQIW